MRDEIYKRIFQFIFKLIYNTINKSNNNHSLPIDS